MYLKALKFFLGKKWLDRRRRWKEQCKFLARRLTKKKEKVGAMNSVVMVRRYWMFVR